MGSIWSKWDILGENVPNLGEGVVKMTSYVKILGKWSKNFFTQKIEKLFQGVYMDEFD